MFRARKRNPARVRTAMETVGARLGVCKAVITDIWLALSVADPLTANSKWQLLQFAAHLRARC